MYASVRSKLHTGSTAFIYQDKRCIGLCTIPLNMQTRNPTECDTLRHSNNSVIANGLNQVQELTVPLVLARPRSVLDQHDVSSPVEEHPLQPWLLRVGATLIPRLSVSLYAPGPGVSERYAAPRGPVSTRSTLASGPPMVVPGSRVGKRNTGRCQPSS